jgi:hypothetical protein
MRWQNLNIRKEILTEILNIYKGLMPPKKGTEV